MPCIFHEISKTAGMHRWVIKSCRKWTQSCTGWFHEIVATWIENCSQSSKDILELFTPHKKLSEELFLPNLLGLFSITQTHGSQSFFSTKTRRFGSAESTWKSHLRFFYFARSSILSCKFNFKPWSNIGCRFYGSWCLRQAVNGAIFVFVSQKQTLRFALKTSTNRNWTKQGETMRTNRMNWIERNCEKCMLFCKLIKACSGEV